MTRRTLSLSVLALLGSLTTGSVALAGPGGGDMGGPFLHAMLTPEQHQELLTALDERQEARKERRGGHRGHGERGGPGERGGR